jgi:hypothetical protein
MGRMRNEYRILDDRSEGKRFFGRPWRIWEHGNEVDLK